MNKPRPGTIRVRVVKEYTVRIADWATKYGCDDAEVADDVRSALRTNGDLTDYQVEHLGTRPSGVPGLVIIGTASYGYSIYWESRDKTRVFAVESPHYLRSPNRFRLVRDAKAAAERLRPLMAWETDLRTTVKAMPWDDRQVYRQRIQDALREAQRAAHHAWYRQCGAYDAA